MGLDPRTESYIATLLPQAQIKARELMTVAESNDISCKIISGYRSFDEQDDLYAHGRTKPGPIITKARGGYSWHNYGVAWDVGIFDGNRYIEESPLYKKLGLLGKSIGLEWGGDWLAFPDEPHFTHNPNKLTLLEARNRHFNKESIV